MWPLGAADSNDARYEAEVEIVGPWDDTEGGGGSWQLVVARGLGTEVLSQMG